MLTNYDGYEWGWIRKEGERIGLVDELAGSVLNDDICGIWGKVYRLDISRPFYFETFRLEGQELTELLRVNMQQCLLYAYPEDYPMPNTIKAIPEQPTGKNYKVLQRWRCKECGHTFYTELLPRLTLKEIWKHLRSFDLSVTIECEICKQISCAKNGKKKMEVQP